MNKELYKILLEQQDEDLGDAPERGVKSNSNVTGRKADDSVDDQIDSLILLYEKRAIRDEEDRLMESLNKTSLKYLLEQEDDAAVQQTPAFSCQSPQVEGRGLSRPLHNAGRVREPLPCWVRVPDRCPSVCQFEVLFGSQLCRGQVRGAKHRGSEEVARRGGALGTRGSLSGRWR